MKVLKFGGTSVGTVESLRNVKSIVESTDEKQIVVVSALGGLTDKLISTARLAAVGDNSYIVAFNEIFKRHQDIIDALIDNEHIEKVRTQVYGLLEELGTIYRGIHLIRDLSSRTLDVVVSYGERMSSVIVSNLIKDAVLFDSKEFIITQRLMGKHILDSVRTENAVRKAFANVDYRIAVVPGFISTDRDSDITNLGRGGSDYTAAILAASLNADILEIWTDVDGFMTADPRIVKDAFVIDNLTFNEAIELCYYGAKVIYPPTLIPVFEKGIPVVVKNTFNPSAPGTLISVENTNNEGYSMNLSAKGLSYIAETSLIAIEGPIARNAASFVPQIFPLLYKNGINLLLGERTDNESVRLAVKSAEAEKAINLIKTNFATDLSTGMISEIRLLTDDVSVIAIIGADEFQKDEICSRLNNVDSDSALCREVLNSLSLNGMSYFAYGSNLALVVPREKMKEKLVKIHALVFNK